LTRRVSITLIAILLVVSCGSRPEGRPSSFQITATERAGTATEVSISPLSSARDRALFHRWIQYQLDRAAFHRWVTWQWEHRNLPHPCRDDVERAIRRTWAGTGDENTMVAIAWRESACTPWARNPNGVDSGLFQLSLPLHDDLFWAVGCNPDTQWDELGCGVKAAKQLWNGCSIGPWSPPYYCRRP